ncbi:hypothetical protein NCAS_0B03160 [Naumovozyma castellii]|uniref:Uncharacterized protein n=1 Tax=Naumovozyma castellii TaxID=27288 RepID=G0VBS4_NAUCA|nr:hypothetical protein NCAS_0B03160 [Naumovozyma castellii CBS 4309]CCC68400.1 hypothetical protein NCAS_0B03160 [Naumovozyma castellii CBS 4309]
MARIGRRGKGPKESAVRLDGDGDDTPSKLLSSMLKTLNLSFERDIGMLDGRSVRTVPPRKTLVELQEQLDGLNKLFGDIVKSDQETIDAIVKIRNSKNKERDSKKQKQFDLPKGPKAQQQRLKSLPTGPAALVKSETSKESSNDADQSVSSVGNLIESKPLLTNGNSNEKLNDISQDVQLKDNKEKELSTVISTPLESNDREARIDLDVDPEKQDELEREPNKVESLTVHDASEKSKKRSVSPTGASSNEPNLKKPRSEEGAQKHTLDTHIMENDPSVKNPKSEFVVSQTLPLAAAALGLFNEEGLKSTGEDFLKKKYNVASYPTNDLKELLPGELPDMDFSCPKPTNQIQYSTFLTSVENFLKYLTEEDAKILKEKYIIPNVLQMDKTYDPEVTPFVIPKLGPLYSHVWFKEDDNKNIANTSPPPLNDPSSILPKKSAGDINDDMLESEEISCGPLVSRLLSAILKEDNVSVHATPNSIKKEQEDGSDNEMKDMDDSKSITSVQTPNTEADDEMLNRLIKNGTTSSLPNAEDWEINNVNLDYPTFEERLKRELKYVGIYMNMPKDENSDKDDLDWITGREDDEISAELRELQNSLKQVTARNQKRKHILIPLLERQLAWQEYSSILDDLDKQIDQAYIKRIRVPKKRKKHHGSGSVVGNSGSASQLAQQKAANSSLKALLDKRQRWMDKIGPLFDKPEIMKRIPKDSVFKNMDQENDNDNEEEDEEEDTDVFDQNGNNKDVELAENQ